MHAKCFGCGASIEADDVDGVVSGFLAHGREKHTWSAPEEALRNYARNYAEATERLSSSTERLRDIGAVIVQSVTEDHIGDWLQLFDRDGFAGNPDWASCYCLEPHVPAAPDLPERPWRTTRATMIERLRRGTTFGYLAYVDSRPVGWVNASFRSECGLFRRVDTEGPAPQSVVAVSCFVIAPPFRRHRVASALLDRVIADAAARGASYVEGYPHNEPDANDAAHFRGARSMFEARGFGVIEMLDRYPVMRRAVR